MNTKVMFAGDIHGNLDHAKWVFDHAVENNVNVIIACGDFGYWPHISWGKKFLNSVERMARKNGIKFYWVDGNHENHDLIDILVEKNGADAPIELGSEWLNYIPRGCVFTIGSKKIMGYGGAYSWDWERRELGISYWSQELINDYKVAELPEQKVDILVTHEAPLGKEISYKDNIAISIHQRELVTEIQEKVNPSLHVCGHHHTRETWMNGDTEVHVLGRDEMEAESVLIIDID
jgi:Icc-related predicted phosphoesterase